ncbi:MAG: signal peptidase I [Candidatus Limnocylindria bacterium]
MIWVVVGRLLAVVVLAAAAAWFVLLRPQAIGGPAAYVLVSGESMEPTLEPGALVIAMRQDEYQVGDVVAYRIPAGDPATGLLVIHRIVGGSAESGFVMRGDNAAGSDVWRPMPADILGRSQAVIPGAMPALVFARSPIVAASAAAALAVYLVLGLWAPVRRQVPQRVRSGGPGTADVPRVEDLSAEILFRR